jgi:hypothetical protein
MVLSRVHILYREFHGLNVISQYLKIIYHLIYYYLNILKILHMLYIKLLTS